MPDPRVLLIEDHAWTRGQVRSLLEAEGMHVTEVARATDAVPTARGAHPDLVLLDLMLPDGNGFDLVDPLRDALGVGVPILAFTGLASGSDEGRLANAGFDDAIAKPIDALRFVETIRAHLPHRGEVSAITTKRRLLLVDDDPVQQRLWAMRLAQVGFDVACASSGPSALALARESEPDLIVSDVLMPGIDGFELCSRVRADPRLAAIPVVLLTNSYLEEDDRAYAARVGADAYLVRTHDVRETVPELERILSRRSKSSRPPRRGELDSEGDRLTRISRQLDRQLERNAALTQRAALLSARLAILGGLTSALAETRNVESALDAALHACVDAGAFSWGALVIRRGTEWVPRTLRPYDGNDGGFRFSPDEVDEVMERLSRDHQARAPLRIPGALVGRDDVDALHVVPVTHRDALLGAILLHAAGALDAQRIAFVDVVAGQVALALVLARTFHDLETSTHAERERAQLLASILDAIGDPILVLDRSSTLVRSNEAAAELVRATGDAPAPTWPERLDMRLEQDTTRCSWDDYALARALRGDAASDVTTIRGKDRERRWIATTARPVLGDGGEVSGAVGVLRDVTAERQATMSQLTSDRLASVGVLAAGVAHEINNPMTSVVQQIEMALEDLPTESPITTRLRSALDAAHRVRTIVADLRTLSRDGSRDAPVPVDVARALDAALRLSHPATRSRAEVTVAIDAVPIALGNEGRLVQVFVNLLVNAAQAIPDAARGSGAIRVRAGSGRAGGARIDVEDNGGGMTPETRSRVFTPFFTTKPVGTGTGLGLSICQRIVADAGGTIECASTLGVGTTFTVWLPPAPLGSAPERVSGVLRGGGRRRLLVIDRDPLVRLSVARSLRSECEVIASDDTEGAWSRLEAGEQFDLVLCEARDGDAKRQTGWAWLVARRPEVATRLVLLTPRSTSDPAPEPPEADRIPTIDKPLGDGRRLRELVLAWPWGIS